jgi:outer membrane protein OmpA-like peptidoglycan-associated protein
MKRVVVLVALMAVVLAALSGTQFRYLYQKDGKYRLLTTVHEDVYYNRVFSYHAEILDRITYEVTDAKDGSGYLNAVFATYEKAGTGGQAYEYSEDYPSEFWRDARGQMTIDPKYFMPVVRNVPVFPDRDLKIGETWSAPAEEVHDFKRDFGIQEPFRVPFACAYTYVGPAKVEGKDVEVVKASYSLYYEPKKPASYKTRYPLSLRAYSEQTINFDPSIGQPYTYGERFKFIFELSDGNTIEFRGSSEGRVLEAPPMDKDQLAKDVKGDLDKAGVGADVRKDDLGVTISMDNILFEPNSAILRDSEKAKLDKIAEILKKYPDRDILVTGHTAAVDSEVERQALSEQRAQAVADYLIKVGARTKEHVLVKGMGSTQPIADNATEEGRKKNRRVEITILEN